MLEKKGWSNARDHYGHSPLHKAVMANQEEVAKYLLENFRELLEVKDNVSLRIFVLTRQKVDPL